MSASQGASRRTTVLDVAKAAGVSAMTVSRVLSPETSKFHVAKDTRERVMMAAKNLNYRPNAGARSIRNHRFQAIGYLRLQDPARPESDMEAWTVGVCDAADDKDCMVSLVRVPSPKARNAGAVPKGLRELHFDAMIVHGLHLAEGGLIQSIRTCGFPTVCADFKAPTNAVFVDEHSAAVRLTQHFLTSGSSRIAFMTADRSPAHFSSADRLAGYQQAMTAAGLEPNVVDFPPVMDTRDPAAEIRAWLDVANSPDALICDGDWLAVKVIPLLLRAGVRIPHDLQLAGFDGDPIASALPVDYTTMRRPCHDMGASAFHMLLSLFRLDPAGGALCPSVIYQADLVVNGDVIEPGSRPDLPEADEPASDVEIQAGTGEPEEPAPQEADEPQSDAAPAYAAQLEDPAQQIEDPAQP